MGRSLWVLDMTSDIDIPVVMAVLHWKEDGQERIEFAAGAHFDLRVADAPGGDRAQSGFGD